jgi:predicted kinase
MEFVILMGLPGSGKTTFFRNRLAATHKHISKDNFRNAPRRDQRQQRLLREALERGQSVVVDNTNICRATRAPLIEIAHSHAAVVIGYFFQSDLAACLERNGEREGKARVPDVAIYSMAARLELPTREEGFDQLFFIRLLGDGEFEISQWQLEPQAGER